MGFKSSTNTQEFKSNQSLFVTKVVIQEQFVVKCYTAIYKILVISYWLSIQSSSKVHVKERTPFVQVFRLCQYLPDSSEEKRPLLKWLVSLTICLVFILQRLGNAPPMVHSDCTTLSAVLKLNLWCAFLTRVSIICVVQHVRCSVM